MRWPFISISIFLLEEGPLSRYYYTPIFRPSAIPFQQDMDFIIMNQKQQDQPHWNTISVHQINFVLMHFLTLINQFVMPIVWMPERQSSFIWCSLFSATLAVSSTALLLWCRFVPLSTNLYHHQAQHLYSSHTRQHPMVLPKHSRETQ